MLKRNRKRLLDKMRRPLLLLEVEVHPLRCVERAQSNDGSEIYATRVGRLQHAPISPDIASFNVVRLLAE